MIGLFYLVIIDPLLSGIRKSVIDSAGNSSRVIDIACGTGTLAIMLARKSGHVTGIDLDRDLVDYARSRAERKGLGNLDFKCQDASDLSAFAEKEFDFAVTSMSVHQFEEETAVSVLKEMKRVAREVIIADYSFPLPSSPAGMLASAIERLAGGDHYRNFRNYVAAGGLDHFTARAGIRIVSEERHGFGVFILARGISD